MSHLSRIETGKVSADTELLGRLAVALRISIKDFFEEEIFPEGGTNNVREKAGVFFSLPGHIGAEERGRIQELITKLEKIPSTDREMVFELLDTIFRRTKEQ
jgi:transcriptional regulator with XRE-family HTH domain